MPTINELGRKVKAKYPGQYDDLSDIELGRRTKAKYPTEYADFADADSGRITVRAHERNAPKRKPAGGGGSWADDKPETAFGNPIAAKRNLVDLATTVGGIAGSMMVGQPEVAAPLAAAKAPMLVRAATSLAPVVARAIGSAAGGGALRNTAQGLSGATPDPSGDAAAMQEQALSSVAGDTFVGGTKLLGKGAMGLATRFTPEIVQTAVREGISATKGGLKRAGALLDELGVRTRQMVGLNPQKFAPTDILNGAGQALVRDVADNQTGLAPEIWQKYREEARAFVQRHTWNGVTRDLTALDLHRLKQDAQKIAQPIFDRIGSMNPPSPTENARAKFYKAIADYAQDVLERTTPQAIDPATGKAITLADLNARTASVIKVKNVLAPEASKQRGFIAQGIEAASHPLGRTVGGMAVGAGAGAGVPGGDNAQQALYGALAGGALANPQLMSMLALALHNPALLETMRQSPRLVMQAAHE